MYYLKICAVHIVELCQWRLWNTDGLFEQLYSVTEYLMICFRIMSVSPRLIAVLVFESLGLLSLYAIWYQLQ